MKHSIENEFLKVSILEKGAELASIIDLKRNQELIWQANDSRFWGRHSSILFPVVGACDNNKIRVNGEVYHMPKHGIVRNERFEIADRTSSKIVLVLESTIKSKEHYPFDWILKVHYELIQNSLSITYEVINDDTVDLPYSIGGHPAFVCPLDQRLQRSDYSLIFNEIENQDSPKIDHNGLISEEKTNILNNSNTIRIKDDLFEEDALILSNYKSSKVRLQANQSSVIEVSIDEFSHLGIWSNPGTPPFVCIEPWCGIADPIGYNGDLCKKPGILNLSAQNIAIHNYTIEVYHQQPTIQQ